MKVTRTSFSMHTLHRYWSLIRVFSSRIFSAVTAGSLYLLHTSSGFKGAAAPKGICAIPDVEGITPELVLTTPDEICGAPEVVFDLAIILCKGVISAADAVLLAACSRSSSCITSDASSSAIGKFPWRSARHCSTVCLTRSCLKPISRTACTGSLCMRVSKVSSG